MCGPEHNHDMIVMLSYFPIILFPYKKCIYLKIIIGDKDNKKHIAYVITSHRDKDNNVNERENWVMKIREAMALFILKHNFLKNMTVRKEKRNSEETIINGVKKIENMLKRIFEKVNR